MGMGGIWKTFSLLRINGKDPHMGGHALLRWKALFLSTVFGDAGAILTQEEISSKLKMVG